MAHECDPWKRVEFLCIIHKKSGLVHAGKQILAIQILETPGTMVIINKLGENGMISRQKSNNFENL